MSQSIRTFVAVRIPTTPQLRGILDDLANMGRAIKAVAPKNLHVTLKFLGETHASWIDPTCELLDDIASQTPAFEVRLQGLGAFPKPSRPSVIWTGITPTEPMRELASEVEETLTTFGFAAEKRLFCPHVTLARVKARPPRGLAALIDDATTAEYASFRVNDVSVIQSVLSPQGPVYTTLYSASLVEGK